MFRETVDFLAAGIASALNLLNSELVLLGGDGLCWTDRHVADLDPPSSACAQRMGAAESW
ncbi:MAG: hypothetical protein ACLTYN_09645 [Dysosmobacter welbionis]